MIFHTFKKAKLSLNVNKCQQILNFLSIIVKRNYFYKLAYICIYALIYLHGVNILLF